MEKQIIPTVYYCYDAWCGWCYGFSPVIKKLYLEFKKDLAFDVLSGGMIFGNEPQPIKTIASYIREAYKTVENTTGIKFGEDFLWHIHNPDQSDWYPDSIKSAIALCIFKDYQPDRAIMFASDLQYALNYEGRDLTDDESYRHLLKLYEIPETDFYSKLKSEEYREKAYYEFALVKQLKVNGFPTVLLQVTDSKFYLVSRGYTDYKTLKERVGKVLTEMH